MYINPIKNKVEYWNLQEKCGFQWEFSAPLWTSTINNVQVQNPDAIQVMLCWNTNLLYDGSIQYDSTLGLPSISPASDNFDLYFLLASNIDINNYNEAEGHPIEEARIWDLEKLLECIKDTSLIDVCATLKDYQVTRWQVYGIPQNFADNNYIGFRVSVSLRKYNK